MSKRGASMLHVRQIMRAEEAAQKPKKARAASVPVRQADTVAPTPERIAQAGPDGYVITPTGQMRVTPAPLDWLAERGYLNRDRDINRLLLAAGDRYRSDWYLSGLGGQTGVTLEQSGGGGPSHPAYMLPNTERAAACRAMWRQAYRAFADARMRSIVGLVVLDNARPQVAGQIVLGIDSPRGAHDRAMAMLKDGLRVLAKHYGMGEKV